MSGVMRRQGWRNILSSAGPLHLLRLAPGLPLESVEEDEARDEAEVEEEHHDGRGNDGGLGTADVARVSNI